jgi:hypothetical protein
MPAPVFLFHQDGSLISLNQNLFKSEDELQSIIAQYPELIVSVVDSVGSLLLVKREAGVPGDDDGIDTFSLDHLFLDNEGILTFVEVKRSTDTRIRREVIGQMLDYAAHAGPFWTADSLSAMFQQTWTDLGKDPLVILEDFTGPDIDHDQFWIQVKTNLQAGRMRLIILADEIPKRLQRVIEFLNNQFDPCEVLGIEIRHYTADNGMRMVAPRVIGQTAILERRKGKSSKQKWTRETFLFEMTKNRPDEEIEVIERILAWVEKNKLRIWWGKGSTGGSFVPLMDLNNDSHQLGAFWTDGYLLIRFNEIKKYDAFTSEESRIGLLKRLNELTGLNIGPERIGGMPKVPLSVFVQKENLEEFLKFYGWFFDEVRRGAASPQSK